MVVPLAARRHRPAGRSCRPVRQRLMEAAPLPVDRVLDALPPRSGRRSSREPRSHRRHGAGAGPDGGDTDAGPVAGVQREQALAPKAAPVPDPSRGR